MVFSMKKANKLIALLTVAVLCVVALVGCSIETSSFSLETSDTTAKITVSNAGSDSTGEGELELTEDAKMTLDASGLTKGKLKVEFKNEDGTDGPYVSVSAKEKNTFILPAGNYTFTVTPEEKSDGTAELRFANEEESNAPITD